MSQQLVIQLSGGGPYGFRLLGGDSSPITVAKIRPTSKAQQAGLLEGDVILAVNGICCRGLSHATVTGLTEFEDYALALLLLRGKTALSDATSAFNSLEPQIRRLTESEAAALVASKAVKPNNWSSSSDFNTGPHQNSFSNSNLNTADSVRFKLQLPPAGRFKQPTFTAAEAKIVSEDPPFSMPWKPSPQGPLPPSYESTMSSVSEQQPGYYSRQEHSFKDGDVTKHVIEETKTEKSGGTTITKVTKQEYSSSQSSSQPFTSIRDSSNITKPFLDSSNFNFDSSRLHNYGTHEFDEVVTKTKTINEQSPQPEPYLVHVKTISQPKKSWNVNVEHAAVQPQAEIQIQFQPQEVRQQQQPLPFNSRLQNSTEYSQPQNQPKFQFGNTSVSETYPGSRFQQNSGNTTTKYNRSEEIISLPYENAPQIRVHFETAQPEQYSSEDKSHFRKGSPQIPFEVKVENRSWSNQYPSDFQPGSTEASRLPYKVHPNVSDNHDQFRVQPNVSDNRDQFRVQPNVSDNRDQFRVQPNVSDNHDQFRVQPSVSDNHDQFRVQPNVSDNRDQFRVQPNVSDNRDQFRIQPEMLSHGFVNENEAHHSATNRNENESQQEFSAEGNDGGGWYEPPVAFVKNNPNVSQAKVFSPRMSMQNLHEVQNVSVAAGDKTCFIPEDNHRKTESDFDGHTQIHPGKQWEKPTGSGYNNPGKEMKTLSGNSYANSGKQLERPIANSYNNPGREMETPSGNSYNNPGREMKTPSGNSYNDPGREMETPSGNSYNNPGKEMETLSGNSYNNPGKQWATPTGNSYNSNPNKQWGQPSGNSYSNQGKQWTQPSEISYNNPGKQWEQPLENQYNHYENSTGDVINQQNEGFGSNLNQMNPTSDMWIPLSNDFQMPLESFKRIGQLDVETEDPSQYPSSSPVPAPPGPPPINLAIYGGPSYRDESDRRFPSLKEKVKIANSVAQSVLSPENQNSRGQKMFLRRKESSAKWTTSSPERPEVADDQPQRSNQNAWKAGPAKLKISSSLPQTPLAPPPPPSLPSPQLPRMQISPSNSLSGDMAQYNGKGGMLFANRKAKSEKWVVSSPEPTSESVVQSSFGESQGYGKAPTRPASETPVNRLKDMINRPPTMNNNWNPHSPSATTKFTNFSSSQPNLMCNGDRHQAPFSPQLSSGLGVSSSANYRPVKFGTPPGGGSMYQSASQMAQPYKTASYPAAGQHVEFTDL